jgi:hypothetical protein
MTPATAFGHAAARLAIGVGWVTCVIREDRYVAVWTDDVERFPE